MNEELNKLLTQLKAVAWFSNCGRPLEGDFVLVKTLDAARLRYAGPGLRWLNFKQVIMNRQTALMDPYRRDEIQQEAKRNAAVLDQWFEENRQRIFSSVKEETELRRTVRQDIGWIAAEITYPELYVLTFASTVLLPIYIAGHLPCGWHGKRILWKWDGNSLADLPEGKIVVF